MNDVRQKIIDTMIEPAADHRSSSTFTGTVTAVNEKANTCSVNYTRTDGKKISKENVPIMLTNKGIIDWFPKENDSVIVQDKNNSAVCILGPTSSNYDNIRSSISLVNDIFSDSFVDTIGGFLF